MTIQKIKNIQLSKPAEYIERERGILKGYRNKLLSDTDWTQCIDVDLTVATVISFRYWRTKVRNIALSDDIDSLTWAIGLAEKTKPSQEKRHDRAFAYVFHQLDHTTIDKFKNSCIIIASQLYPHQMSISEDLEESINELNDMDEVFAKLINCINYGY